MAIPPRMLPIAMPRLLCERGAGGDRDLGQVGRDREQDQAAERLAELRRVASTSVVSDSLIPANHTASAASAKTATTAGSGRPDTGGKDTKRRGHRPGAARIGAWTRGWPL